MSQLSKRHSHDDMLLLSQSPCGLLDNSLCGTSDTLGSHRHWRIPKVHTAKSYTSTNSQQSPFSASLVSWGSCIILLCSDTWCKFLFVLNSPPSTYYTLLVLCFLSTSHKFLLFQLVQRINSIYCTKRGKKRLKKLSMSNVETTSLRGNHTAGYINASVLLLTLFKRLDLCLKRSSSSHVLT